MMPDSDLTPTATVGSDAEAFAQMVERFQQLVLATCRRRLSGAADLEDAFQETFLRLARAAPPAHLGGWLHRCALNVSRDMNRRRATRDRHERGAARADPVAAADHDLAELREHLDVGLAKLSAAERELIIQRFFVGTTQTGLAAEEGVTPSAISHRLDRAVEALRRHLSSDYVATPALLVRLLQAENHAAMVPASFSAGARAIGLHGIAPYRSALKFLSGIAASTVCVLGTAVWLILRFVPAGVAPLPNATPPVAVVAALPTATQPSGPIRAINKFECGSPLTYELPEPDHVLIGLAGSNGLDTWLFRLDGVAGKTVTIDIQCDRSLSKWGTLNPVYADALPLDDPALYAAAPSTGTAAAEDGVGIPDTSGQRWHFIRKTTSAPNHFQMVQTFTADSVLIGARVPYPPSYHAKLMTSLGSNPLVKIVNVDPGNAGGPLLVAEIDGGGSLQSKPCILIAGGEQANQPDGMWSAVGALQFLIGSSDEARHLRQQCRFLIVPMLDPQGASHVEAELPGRFAVGSTTPTSLAWAAFFQQWVNAGNRLDVVLELHNVQASEFPHLSLAYIEHGPTGVDLADTSDLAKVSLFQGDAAGMLNKAVVARFDAAHLNYSGQVQTQTVTPDRFGPWLAYNYGPLLIVYEVNAQAPVRHLDLSQLKQTGELFVQSVGDFFSGSAGAVAVHAADALRASRQKRLAGNSATRPTQNPIELEQAARSAAAATGPADGQ